MWSDSSGELGANSNSRVHTGATREFGWRHEPMGSLQFRRFPRPFARVTESAVQAVVPVWP
jgi:hypothetical protein